MENYDTSDIYKYDDKTYAVTKSFQVLLTPIQCLIKQPWNGD